MANEIAAQSITIENAQIGPKTSNVVKKTSIIGFLNDAQTMAIMHDALSIYAKDSIDLRRGDILLATEVMARTPSPDILIVDIAGIASPIEALSNLADVVEPGIQVLVIGDPVDVDSYRQIVRGLGIDEYIFKPISREMVARYFGPLISHKAPAADIDRGGRVVAVIGARGGVGATTIAAGLGWHLGVGSSRHTALIAADLQRGASTAMLLGAKPGNGLKAAFETPDRIDSLFVERAATNVAGRLSIFASETPFDKTTELAEGGPQKLINALRLKYNFILLDISPSALHAHPELLQIAHHRIVIFDQTMSGLRDGLRIAAIERGPFQPQRATIILNKYDQRLHLSANRIEAETNATIDVTIPDMGYQFTQASNMGEPLIDKFKPFKQSIISIAHEVGLTDPSVMENRRKPARAGSVFMRLIGKS
jgi:pilus assembly protein CpaE